MKCAYCYGLNLYYHTLNVAILSFDIIYIDYYCQGKLLCLFEKGFNILIVATRGPEVNSYIWVRKCFDTLSLLHVDYYNYRFLVLLTACAIGCHIISYCAT